MLKNFQELRYFGEGLFFEMLITKYTLKRTVFKEFLGEYDLLPPAIAPLFQENFRPPPPENEILDKTQKKIISLLFYDLIKVYFFCAKFTLSEQSLPTQSKVYFLMNHV